MKYVNMDGKKYRILRKTSDGFAVADYRAITSKKDYGWKPVKNYAIRKKLGKK